MAEENPKWFESKEKNPRVGIAISSIGQVSISFTASLSNLIRRSMFEGIVIDIAIDIAKPLDKSRNNCVKKLLEKDPDYIFFIDTDMTLLPDTLVQLMKQDKDIITGIYCYKRAPYSPVLKMLDKENNRYLRLWKYPRDKVFKVDGCGAGCLLVKRKAIDGIGEPWFKWGKNISEDFYFCHKATEKGFEIWADGKVECGHISQFMPVMPESFWQMEKGFKEKLGQLEKETHIKFADYELPGEEPKA